MSDEFGQSDSQECIGLVDYLRQGQERDWQLTGDKQYLDDPILRQIGDTPLIEHPNDKNVLCKLERESPTRSHKDRLALGMLLEMRKRGEIEPGEAIVEASSGNMGGGVALVANRLGHPCTIVTPETASPIKMGYVRSLGAELKEVPSASHDANDYYQNQARQYAEETDAVLINQYERSLNPEVHYLWTGPELWSQIEGREVTHIVAATGSGGTLSGLGRYIKEQDETITTVGVDAERSNISRDFNGKDRIEYETEIEGLGQYRTTDAISFDAIDEMVSVPDETVLETTRRVSEEHALLVGPSSGAVLHVAETIRAENDDARVVAIVHDGAEQYYHQIDGWS